MERWLPIPITGGALSRKTPFRAFECFKLKQNFNNVMRVTRVRESNISSRRLVTEKLAW